MDETENKPRAATEETAGFITARFDHPHPAARINAAEPVAKPSRIQPRRAKTKAESAPQTHEAGTSQAWAEALDKPVLQTVQREAMPSLTEFEELAPITARHADDIAWHLTQRLRETEQRELNVAEYSSRLEAAEAAAQAWVMERENEFHTHERALRLREDELDTRLAATAAVEITAQEEQHRWRAEWETQVRGMQQREASLAEQESRCQGITHSLATATERFQAEQHRQEEQWRARRQQWETLCEQDRAQAERVQLNLQRHRKSLELREQQIRAQEASLANMQLERIQAERLRLETERWRMEAAQERRIATEQRWIAGRLWAKLTETNLASDQEIQTVLQQVRQELEIAYRRERESLERVRIAMLGLAQQLTQPVIESADKPTALKRPQPAKTRAEVKAA